MFLRKSEYVLKLLVQKHRGKLLAGIAVGMGATAYLQSKVSKSAPSEAPKTVRTRKNRIERGGREITRSEKYEV